jgi:hypothetical protein
MPSMIISHNDQNVNNQAAKNNTDIMVDRLHQFNIHLPFKDAVQRLAQFNNL